MILLLFVSLVFQEPQTDVEKMFAACVKEGEQRHAALRSRISVARSDLRKLLRKRSAPSLSTIDNPRVAEIVEAKHLAESMKRAGMPTISSHEYGVYGIPKNKELIVLSVIDNQSFLGKLHPDDEDSRICIFENIDVSDVVDNTRIEVGFALFRDGTGKFRQGLGQKTTYRYRRPTDKETIELSKMIDDMPDPRIPREWKNEAGDVIANGMLIYFDLEKVKIKIDDDIKEFEISEFCESDRKLISEKLGID